MTPDTMPQRTADTETFASEADAAIAWLESEFPGWTISIDRTAGWQGELRPIWIARSEGHHPQAELTAAKLHTRLTDYHAREQRRNAFRN